MSSVSKKFKLFNLKHNDVGVLVGFSCNIVDKERGQNEPEYHCFTADWTKGELEGEWNMRVILPRTRDADSQVYIFCYQMPKDGLPVELVVATGLRYYQLYLQQEIQMKSNFDFVLGELLRGM